LIFLNSRYVTNPVVAVYFPDSETTKISVFRSPSNITKGRTVKYYQWREGDRIDQLAYNIFGDPELWWRLLDVNPDIQSPYDLKPGDLLRIPA
jgi:hypothetical protein